MTRCSVDDQFNYKLGEEGYPQACGALERTYNGGSLAKTTGPEGTLLGRRGCISGEVQLQKWSLVQGSGEHLCLAFYYDAPRIPSGNLERASSDHGKG